MAWWSESGSDDRWSGKQQHIFDSVTHSNSDAQHDTHLARLFNETIFERQATKGGASTQELEDYLWEEYEINFADEMDWEAWREWYEGG